MQPGLHDGDAGQAGDLDGAVEVASCPTSGTSRTASRAVVSRPGRKRQIRRRKKKNKSVTVEPVDDQTEEETEPPSPAETVTSFTALAADFEVAIDDLAQREGLENLHTDFARVFRRLEESRQREMQLLAKVTQLEAEVSHGRARVRRQALSGTMRWRAEITRVAELEEEVVQLRGQCDVAATREHTALEALDGVRKQLARVQQEMKDARFLDQDVQDVHNEKKAVKLARERDLLLIKVSTLQEKLEKSQVLQADLQHRASVADLRLDEVKQALSHETERKQREMDARNTLEEGYRALQSELEAKKNELSHLQLQNKTANIKISQLEVTVTELSDANESLTKESADLALRVGELKSSIRRRCVELDNAMTNFQDVTNQLHHVEACLTALEQKVSSSESLNKALGVDLERTRGRVQAAIAETTKCRTEGRQLQRFLNDAQQQLQTRERTLRGLDASRELLTNRVERITVELKEQVEVVAKKNSYIRELERALEEARVAQDKLVQQATATHRGRERLAGELATARRLLEAEVEEASSERRVAERCRRDLAEYKEHVTQLKLRQDANERHTMMLGRQTAAAADREEDMKTQVKALTQLVEQLKEEVLKRDREFGAERKRREACENTRTQLLAQVDGLHSELSRRAGEAAELERRLRQDARTIREVTEGRDDARKQRLVALNERDIFGTQITRRNDEIELLRQKVDVLQRALQAGGRELECSRGAVCLMRLEVRKLRWEKTLLTKNIAAMPRLERELYHAVQDLSRSQHLSRALESELRTPVNFHRWRRLEGGDLPHLEVLTKVRVLQRRLLSRTEHTLVQEARLRETESLYLQLRQAFVRQATDPTTLLLTRAALQDKQRKIKGLMVEVSLSETAYSQLESANKEITRLKSASAASAASRRTCTPTRGASSARPSVS